jgi:anti-anti-sigma factor
MTTRQVTDGENVLPDVGIETVASPPTEFAVSVVRGITVLHLAESCLDLLTVARLERDLKAFARMHRPIRLVVNFDRVVFFSARAIGVLIQLANDVRGFGGDIKLCSMSKFTREVFCICKLIPKVFQLHNSMGEALRAFDRESF